MKLLIVDDETHTRDGLSAVLSDPTLGLSTILTAQDGLAGYQLALKERPDIILSDVRMPRMTGIEMLDKVRAALPDCVFIFMSGFSDKEYLKAAIRLEAVSYVEKPLDPDEVKSAVRDAIERSNHRKESLRAVDVQNAVSSERLALSLTKPASEGEASDLLERSIARYFERYGSPDSFHAAFTILLSVDPRTELSPDFIDQLMPRFHDALRLQHHHVIGAEKKTNIFVFHIFRRESFTEATVSAVCRMLCGLLPDTISYYVTAGKNVSSVERLYDSYAQAVMLMQRTFFLTPGSILTSLDALEAEKEAVGCEQEFSALQDKIRTASREEVYALRDQLKAKIRLTPLLPQAVRSGYYRLLETLAGERALHHLPVEDRLSLNGNILNTVNTVFSFDELSGLFDQALTSFYQDLSTSSQEDTTVAMIRQYIESNASHPSLSTQEISDYVGRSPSYVCTLFKTETGKTLNQYITEFRMKKAQLLLQDSRNNVSSIAEAVGYNDSNYFGKAFRKFFGFSPSEYRAGINGGSNNAI